MAYSNADTFLWHEDHVTYHKVRKILVIITGQEYMYNPYQKQARGKP
jgi:hypothetical protein